MTGKIPDPGDWISQAIQTLPLLCTAEETADLLRRSKRTVYRLIDEGWLDAVRPREGRGSRFLVPRASIGKYLRYLERIAA